MIYENMDWEKLLGDECPKRGCEMVLEWNQSRQGYECADCGFFITNDKKSEIERNLKNNL